MSREEANKKSGYFSFTMTYGGYAAVLRCTDTEIDATLAKIAEEYGFVDCGRNWNVRRIGRRCRKAPRGNGHCGRSFLRMTPASPRSRREMVCGSTRTLSVPTPSGSLRVHPARPPMLGHGRLDVHPRAESLAVNAMLDRPPIPRERDPV